MKTEREFTELLDKLISRWEDEVVEFKQGGAGYSTHDIGKSFSALSNEANLREHIVVGTENSPGPAWVSIKTWRENGNGTNR